MTSAKISVLFLFCHLCQLIKLTSNGLTVSSVYRLGWSVRTLTLSAVSQSTSRSYLDSSEQHQRSSQTPATVHLISLPDLTDSSPRIIRDLWKWKDCVLGDGRDFFLPKPRTIQAFIHILLGATCSCRFLDMTVEECVLLSNCARMDLVLVIRSHHMNLQDSQHTHTTTSRDNIVWADTRAVTCKCTTNSKNPLPNFQLDSIDPITGENIDLWKNRIEEQFVRHLLAHCLASQLTYSKERQQEELTNPFRSMINSVSNLLDSPDHLYTPQNNGTAYNNTNTYKNENTNEISGIISDHHSSHAYPVSALASLFTYSSNLTHISRHFCYVAAGMALRPSRPGRPVPFRPYSSRDAHIMLQLKRTVDIVSSLSFPRIKIIFDSALQAGKAARNHKIVPSLIQLQRYPDHIPAPSPILLPITHDVERLVIEPIVSKCIERYNRFDSNHHIIDLQKRVYAMLEEHFGYEAFAIQTLSSSLNHVTEKTKSQSRLERNVKKILHEAYVSLRSGSSESIDIDRVLKKIEQEIHQHDELENKYKHTPENVPFAASNSDHD